MRERAYAYLERELARAAADERRLVAAYTAWQAFAVKVLVEGGRNQDSNLTRLYGYRDRMPVFALAYLHDALVAKGETRRRRASTDLRRRMANAILPEGGSAHVEELSDPYLLWFWNSNVRSTAIVLNSLVQGRRRRRADPPAGALADGGAQERPLGQHAGERATRWRRWSPTTASTRATSPDFRAVVTLGADELAREEFTRPLDDVDDDATCR